MTEKLFQTNERAEPHDQDDLDQRYEADGDLPVNDSAPEADFGLTRLTQHNDPLAFAEEQQRKLALALDFGPDDLLLNGEGELSPAQMDRLNKDLWWFYGPMIGVCVAFALLFGLIGMVGDAGLFFPALLMLALAVLPSLLLKQERENLPRRPVQRTMMRLGTLSLTARRLGLLEGDKLPAMGDKPVFAPGRLYKALQANRTYILYYTPVRTWRGYRLLSLEPTEDMTGYVKPKRKPKRG